MMINKKNLNILMINPKNTIKIFQDFNYVLPHINKQVIAPPYPLLTVAGLIPKGHAIKIVDLNVRELTKHDYKWADMAFITGIELHRNEIKKISHQCKIHSLYVVAGGLCVTRNHNDFPDIDTFFIGEVENTIADFFSDLSLNVPKKNYRAIEYPELTTAPVPRFDLIDMKPYAHSVIQWSRGCPFSCDFCQLIGIYGNRTRFKSSENILKELDLLNGTGFRGSIMFGDDNFLASPHVRDLIIKVKNWQKKNNYPFKFYVQTDISIASKEDLMSLMIEAGFDAVQIGIESPSVSSLQSVNKILNTKYDLVESVRKIHRFGLEVYAAMLVGLDGDPENIFELQYKFLHEAGIPHAMISLLDVSSGTPLYEKMKKEGRILNEFKGFNTGTYVLNYRSKIDPYKLVTGYLKLIVEAFKTEAYFERCLTFLNDYKLSPIKSPHPFIMNLYYFIRFLLRKYRSPYSKLFRRFLWRVLVNHPTKFTKASELGFKGYQFYRMTIDEINNNTHLSLPEEKWILKST